MKKVIFVHGFLGAGGAEELRLTMLKYFNRSKYEPIVCSLSTKGIIGREIEKLGIKVIALNQTHSIYHLKTLYALYRLFKREKPDIIETCMFNSSFYGIIAGKLAGVKQIFAEIHGTDTFKKWWHKSIDRFLFRYVDKIITCSNFIKEFTAMNERIPLNKFQSILNVIDPCKFSAAPSQIIHDKTCLRKELGIKKGQRVIGIIGRLHIEKGHIYLLKALRHIKKKFPNILLLIVGTGPMQKKLEAFCKSNSLQNNTRFLGIRRDIPTLIKLMELTVLPSINEGFGIVLLESLYCKVPCVASSVGGIPEVITNGKHGYLVPSRNPDKLADAIIKMLRHPQIAKKMGVTGHKLVVAKFMPERYIHELDKIYAGRR